MHLYSTVNGTIGGGFANTVSGSYGTVPGGFSNTVSATLGFAAGYGGVAKDMGSFVWGDSTPVAVLSTGINSWTARCSGGVTFWSNPTMTVGVVLGSGSGSWAMTSDRNTKENVRAVDARQVLEKVAAMPITSWNYKTQDRGIRHLGPMGQDFSAAFHLGEDERHISTVDEGGVALAAIQGLNQKLNEKDAEIQGLKQRLEKLEQLMSRETGAVN